jgi:YggT family protein
MAPLIGLLSELIWIYELLLIAQAILSWLLAFGVVNRYNRAVATISDFLYRITEPALRPIRSFLPNLGGVDISPIILFFILELIRREMLYYLI